MKIYFASKTGIYLLSSNPEAMRVFSSLPIGLMFPLQLEVTMQAYFVRNLSELAEKKAIFMRQEAQLWDILARDLKREAGRQEEIPARRSVRDPLSPRVENKIENSQKLVVRIHEAAKMMGMSRSSLYKEINAGNIKVKKAGRNTLIAINDIQDWFEKLPEGVGP